MKKRGRKKTISSRNHLSNRMIASIKQIAHTEVFEQLDQLRGFYGTIREEVLSLRDLVYGMTSTLQRVDRMPEASLVHSIEKRVFELESHRRRPKGRSRS